MEYTTLSGAVKTFIPGDRCGFTATQPPVGVVLRLGPALYLRLTLGLLRGNVKVLNRNFAKDRLLGNCPPQDYVWEQGTDTRRLDGL